MKNERELLNQIQNNNHRLLIVSNNVLSTTRSNGKVVMSYFDCLPSNMIQQLYFSNELPSIPGYKYFQITDKDIIKGQINRKNRGRAISEIDENNYKLYNKPTSQRYKTPFFRLVREILWKGKWKSPSLIQWLDDYSPTDVFFVGGDSLFAYSITDFIVRRYNARLSIYITDDYILPRKHDGILAAYRRKLVKKSLVKTLTKTKQLFTISKQMREAYIGVLGRDSCLVTNMVDCLKDDHIEPYSGSIVLVYAGSLYYGRSRILNMIARTISSYNETAERKAILKVYTNLEPSESELEDISVEGASEYCGRLTKEQLVVEMNRCTILCIVESFEENQIEATRLSLSTKVSEYMAVGKPILAVGPAEIGTIDYLLDSAACITSEMDIKAGVVELLKSAELQKRYGQLALQKYEKYHVKHQIQGPFISKVFGETL